ncbi:MAG: alanine racemase [Litorimonas sp.]
MSLPPYSTRPTLRVDLDRIKTNYEALKALAPRSKVAASVKADAYGLGAEAVGRALYGAGCRIFFVATAGEGKFLRDAVGPNAAIYVLNGPAPRDKATLLGAKLKPVINSIGQARYWATVVRETNEPPFTAIHIDTGMNRLGFSAAELAMLSSDGPLWKALNPDWVMSHLACAPFPDNPLNAEQLKQFKRLAATLPPTPLSLCNTAGIYLGKDYHFQMVRPGIGLYGGSATDRPEREVTRPAVRLLAPILQLREVDKGESLGYNSTHVAPRDMRIAVIGGGYADGVPVSLSNTGHAVIHDQKAPIVGRVSMDLTILDVTDIALPVQVGGVAVFLGDEIETQADAASTISYELLVRIGDRVRRDYWKPRTPKGETAPPSEGRPKSSGQKPRGSVKGRPRPGKKPQRRQRSPGR